MKLIKGLELISGVELAFGSRLTRTISMKSNEKWIQEKAIIWLNGQKLKTESTNQELPSWMEIQSVYLEGWTNDTIQNLEGQITFTRKLLKWPLGFWDQFIWNQDKLVSERWEENSLERESSGGKQNISWLETQCSAIQSIRVIFNMFVQILRSPWKCRFLYKMVIIPSDFVCIITHRARGR